MGGERWGSCLLLGTCVSAACRRTCVRDRGEIMGGERSSWEVRGDHGR